MLRVIAVDVVQITRREDSGMGGRGEASGLSYIKRITNEMGCFELADHTGLQEREKARELELHMWQQ
ncbi:uncharacterized [Tachysurus ichikawai]